MDIPWASITGAGAVGVTAGASAPESLVEEVIAALRSGYAVTLETVTTAEEPWSSTCRAGCVAARSRPDTNFKK